MQDVSFPKRQFQTTSRRVITQNTEEFSLIVVAACGLSWFRRYLTNHRYFFTHLRHFSSPFEVLSGFPQGSALGYSY